MTWNRERTDYSAAILALAQMHLAEKPPAPKPPRVLRARLAVWETICLAALGSCRGQWCWLHWRAYRRYVAALKALAEEQQP